MARRPRPIRQRITDRALGVNRRRRRVAYYAIGTGLALLRPVFVRMAWTVGAVVLLSLAVTFAA